MLATLKETARALNCTPATVVRMVERGEISQARACKLGDRWRFDLQGVVDDLLARPTRRNP